MPPVAPATRRPTNVELLRRQAIRNGSTAKPAPAKPAAAAPAAAKPAASPAATKAPPPVPTLADRVSTLEHGLAAMDGRVSTLEKAHQAGGELLSNVQKLREELEAVAKAASTTPPAASAPTDAAPAGK